MALNALTLSVTGGVQGRRFKSAISGQTAGNIVEVLPHGAPGFGVSNGILSNEGLPYDLNLARLRERNPVTGENRTTELLITAVSDYAIRQQAAGIGGTYQGAFADAQGDGSLIWKLAVVSAQGATTTANIGKVGITGTPGFATIGTAYSFTPTTSGGQGTKVFAYTGTTLSTYGLSFNTSTGAITGTASGSAGTITGSIAVTDDSGTSSLPVSIGVYAALGPTTATVTISTPTTINITGLSAGETVTATSVGTVASGSSISVNTAVNVSATVTTSAGRTLGIAITAAAATTFIQPYNRLFLPAMGDSRPAQEGQSHYGGPPGTAQVIDENKAGGITAWMHRYLAGKTRYAQSFTLGSGAEAATDTLLLPRPINPRPTFTGTLVGNVLTITSFQRSTNAVLAVGQLLGGPGVAYGTYLASGSGNNWTVAGGTSNLSGSVSGLYTGDARWDLVAVAQHEAANVFIMIGTNSSDADITNGSAFQLRYKDIIRALTDPTYVLSDYGAPLPLYQGRPKNLWLVDEETQGVTANNVRLNGRSSQARIDLFNTDQVPFVRTFDAASGHANANPRVKVIKLWDDPRFYDTASGNLRENLPGLLADGMHFTPVGASVAGKISAETVDAVLDNSVNLFHPPDTTNVANFVNPNPLFTGSGSTPGGNVTGTLPASTRFNGTNAGCTYVITKTTLPGNEGVEWQIAITGTPTGTAGQDVSIMAPDQIFTAGGRSLINMATDKVRLMGYLSFQINAGAFTTIEPFFFFETIGGNTNTRINANGMGAGAATYGGSPIYFHYPQVTSPWGTVYTADASIGYLPMMSPTIDFTQYSLTGNPGAGLCGLNVNAMVGVPIDAVFKFKRWGVAKVTD